MQSNDFTCPRTCRLHDLCRFMPVLGAIGKTMVTSHTLTIKTEFRDADTLRDAVEGMGGAWRGMGTHRLFEGMVTGLGFTLPGWTYPLAVTDDGTLQYDDFNGQWGNPADLERLRTAYNVSRAEQAALAQGWLTEKTPDGLVIHHPDGGSITLTGETADFQGFVGEGCHAAREALGLAGEVTNRPEVGAVQANLTLRQR